MISIHRCSEKTMSMWDRYSQLKQVNIKKIQQEYRLQKILQYNVSIYFNNTYIRNINLFFINPIYTVNNKNLFCHWNYSFN